MNEQDVTLNNTQGLIYHKTQPDQTRYITFKSRHLYACV